MILVDANILIYATTECPEQKRALEWLDGTINTGTRVGLPWASLLAFTRVVTDFRLYKGPLTTQQACGQIERWLDCPNIWTPGPSYRHMMFLRGTLEAIGAKSRLTPDAHLAALAMEHGLTLCSADRDFSRFPGLKWMNPLSAS